MLPWNRMEHSGAIKRSAISAQAASIARLNCASDDEDSHLDDDDDEASGDLPDASHDAHWAHRQAGWHPEDHRH